MDTSNRLHNYISALADGALPEDERELALAALATPEGQAAWRAYHLVGEALRAGVAAVQPSAAMAERLARRLADEPPLRPEQQNAAPGAAHALENLP
ncbi:sigma-E factor negative regulatory protein [Oxalobacteraceae bacterium A2-2]|jgi:sigma-E factor negative regulatory protein RseA